MTCLLNGVTALVVMNEKGVQIIFTTILDGSDRQLIMERINFKRKAQKYSFPVFLWFLK